jgi:hypothetical protein
MMNTLMRWGGTDKGDKNMKLLKPIYVWEKKINIHETMKCVLTFAPLRQVRLTL